MLSNRDFTIAHLSDLHLGDDFVWRSIRGLRWWWNTEDALLLEQLADALREAKPDFVILSGDIVNKSTPETFEHASSVLKTLFLAAHVDLKKQVFVIPGNHDVRVFPEEHKHFRRLELFVEFLKELFGEDDVRTRTERFAFADPSRKVVLFGLDSTLKLDSTRIENQPIAEGKVGSRQLSWLERKHAAYTQSFPDYQNWVKIVAVHHHARSRHQHRQPPEKLDRVEHDVRRPIAPGLPQLQPHLTLRGQVDPLLRHWRSQRIAAGHRASRRQRVTLGFRRDAANCPSR